MFHYKKFSVVAALLALTAIGISAMRPADDKPRKMNLKVLPKHISHDDLMKTMDAFKAALGVKCNFCHAQSADSSAHHLDFASDAKPEKNIARHMYTMVGKINKKFFKDVKDDSGQSVQVVTCMTCHHGSPHPEGGAK
ncbi:MAG TPA: c-type cytochrome [Puia sp.]|nr:c-type cytochrome [Puia sp.]